MSRLPQIAQFDVEQGIRINDNARARYLDDQKRSALQRIGDMAAGGDLQAASSEAFRSGQLDVGASLRGMNQQEQAKLVEDAASWAYAAKDPQTWEAGRQQWLERGFDIGGFETREQLLARALSVKEQMGMDFQREQANRQQANADRSFGLQRQRLQLAQTQGGPNGKAPSGYQFKPDGTLEPIPGGPAAVKAGQLDAKTRARSDGAIAQADRLITKVDQALGKVGMNTAGFGSALQYVPGTEARDLSADIETIKANLGFAELQAMRDASPTGGALGQVAIQELIALQSTVASLDQAQTPAQLTQRLNEIRTHYENWKQAVIQSRAEELAPGPMPNSTPNDYKQRYGLE